MVISYFCVSVSANLVVNQCDLISVSISTGGGAFTSGIALLKL
ncbi:hypothetical protein Ga0466249_001260 [Sporomusaceae bacterium BoRhaA]|nr:hypothetical protein [Pelorhabdus rhamnosifermentans]